MPSERPVQRLQDILENIERVRSYTAGLDREAYLRTPLVMDAVERCLERMAEAARKLGDRYDGLNPEADLPSLRRFGSVLRHDYDAINPLLVWLLIENRLDVLEATVRHALSSELAKD